MVPVKVDINALIEVSQLNICINPHSSVATENLSYWFMILKMKEFFFFLSGFSFTDTDNSQNSRGRKRNLFYSTLPLTPAHEHSDIYVQLCTWGDSHIFSCNACIYQTATQWDLPPYQITVWLIDDVILI